MTQSVRDPVEGWFRKKDGFLETLFITNPRSDWPDVETKWAFWQNWITEFKRRGVHEDEANEAAGRVAASPPGFVADYLPAIILQVREIHEVKARGVPDDGSLRQSKEECRDCPECRGCGWASRNFRMPSHSEHLMRAAMICRCAAGRSLLSVLNAEEDSLLEPQKTVDDLQAHPRLWSAESLLFNEARRDQRYSNDDAYWTGETFDESLDQQQRSQQSLVDDRRRSSEDRDR
jgi:hypothetical protein